MPIVLQEISTTPVKPKLVASCPVEVIDMCHEEDKLEDKLMNNNDNPEEICDETGDYHLVSIISHTGGSSRFGKIARKMKL